MRRRLLVLVAAAAVVAGIAFLPGAVSAAGRDDVSRAKAGTGGFHSLARAEQAGYGILHDQAGLTCIEHMEGMPMGAMGTHFVKGALVGDGVVDPATPEALLYDRTGGRDRLLGAEYVVFAADWKGADPPRLFDTDFKLVLAGNRYGLPDFYELHAWLWDDNPAGMFKDWNPNVHC